MFRLNLSSIRPKLSKGADACTFRARLHFSYRQEDKRLSNAAYFLKVMTTQCWLALVMTAWIAPRLVSFEIADNALPILLSRPISRLGYVLGKFAALFAYLSLVTWIPRKTVETRGLSTVRFYAS